MDFETVDADEFYALEAALAAAEQRSAPQSAPVGTTCAPLPGPPAPGGALAPAAPAQPLRLLSDVLGVKLPAPGADGARPADGAFRQSEPTGAAPGEHARVGLQLLPSARVAVIFAPSCLPVAEAVAAAPGACPPTRGGVDAWTVPASSVSALCGTLRSLPGLSACLELPHTIAASAMEFAVSLLAEAEVEAAYARVPAPLRDAMFEFQRVGVKYVIARQGRALIGDEMGLGKTVQAIALLACYSADRPALILCPSSLRDCWKAALATWLPEEPGAPKTAVKVVLNGAGVQDALRGAGRQGIVICPYSLVIKQPALFAKHNFGMVVADESHCLMDSKAQRTQAAAPLLASARRAVCLTGTPALSRPIELFSQLQALQPRLFRSVHDYAGRFCQGGRFGWAKGCSHGDELHAVLGTTVLVRRLKRDVLDQLPPKIRTRVVLPVQPSSEVKRLTGRLGELRATGGDKHLLDQLTNELYTKTAEMKASACADYMETLLEGSPAEAKFLFFAHHSVVLDTLGSRMKTERVRHITIVGATPVGDRANLVAQFQNDPDVRVALLSIKAAGVGLTLTAASTVVFGELTWTPGDIVQAEDRAHRIGQLGSVAVHILQAPGTIDDALWSACCHKLDTLGRVLDGASTAAGLQATTAAVEVGRPPGGGGAGGGAPQPPPPGSIQALLAKAAGGGTSRAALAPVSNAGAAASNWECAWGTAWEEGREDTGEARAKRPRVDDSGPPAAPDEDWGSGW